MKIVQAAFESKSKDYEQQISELKIHLTERNDYIKRLEKRNAQLEKQVIDQMNAIQEQQTQIKFRDRQIQELESKYESLEKIRKDIINTVSQHGSGGNSLVVNQHSPLIKENYQTNNKTLKPTQNNILIQNSQTFANNLGKFINQDDLMNFKSLSPENTANITNNNFLSQQQHIQNFQKLNQNQTQKESSCLDYPLIKQNLNTIEMKENKNERLSHYQNNGPIAQSQSSSESKIFFKNVKARLSEEKFNEFLLNVKRLNGKVQSKAQTLINIAKLFGKENDDLFKNFEHIICPSTQSQ
ncbi:UNKNOWN [Stylonychia lemnae]|uniref:At4g15545-like C-terminal domain-containing protein n=1 Tax=Stylonychia lemnae TaxID=5949 RepID=A0A078ABA1_STYLE|nr:UNKNOWN [Stylonychia lemnae]|eukprot:CDW78063.1 UNKNOWN [Stylonychia lemnae]